MELTGLKSYAALMIYINRLPWFIMDYTGSDSERLAEFKADPDNKKALVSGLAMHPLNDEEVFILLSFHKNKHGVPINKSLVHNKTPQEILDMVIETLLAVSTACSSIYIITEKELGTVPEKSIDVKKSIMDHPDVPLDDNINRAIENGR